MLTYNENIKNFTDISRWIELEVECLWVQHTTFITYAGQ